ncbi:hypothetical protein BJV82DRAFT_661719 [Fennellomyces sp. T-0311]|nr:hypothetical protein BJV82DRAFT_661719 [Fennellomyces sp. T-0311]
MYIVYDGYQKEVIYSEGITIPGIRIKLDDEEVPEFKPSLLVRTADMEVVEGSTVDDHYWTISYSWNQSGEIFKNDDGEYDRVDDGKHEIITYQSGEEESYDWMPVESVDRDTASTQYGKFEQVIQQICSDFGVQYVWYDQMCINQNDHDAKIQEIKQMHHIYKNARCTIALIPELEFIGDTNEAGLDNTDLNVIPESQWSRRIWTLEEAYMSRTILFLGRNVHLWSSDLDIHGVREVNHFLENIQNKADNWRASTALWYARTRTSTKAHDRVFALVNIFPELKHGVTFSYRQPLIDLMVQFYGLLAQKDISILLFGSPHYIDSDQEIAAVRQEEASLLPSWTGAAGVHLSQDQLDNEHVESTADYTIDEKYLNITSAFIPIRIEPADSVEIHDPEDGPHNGYTEDGLPWVLCDADEGGEDVNIADEQVLTFVAVPSESQDDYPNYIKHSGLKTTHFLPTKEADEGWISTLSKPTHISAVLSLTKECSECFVLTEVVFPLRNELFQFHPVVGKYEDHYESVGACFLLCELNFDSFIDQAKQDFVIE